jgi:hypothetical protein
MMHEEFEKLTIRENSDRQTISGLLYQTIEHFYTSDNNYHLYHGGINETKQEFVKRVFGGKVNTPKTILEKTIAESIRENRYCLQGNETATKSRLDEMDILIRENYTWKAQYNY